MGETAFAAGDYVFAERDYRAPLKTAPNYFRAFGSLGRVRAGQHDFPGAISYYEQAVRIVPVLDFMAALGDLYHLTGRERDAAIRYELVEQLGEHSRKVHGTPYDRHVPFSSQIMTRNPKTPTRWPVESLMPGVTISTARTCLPGPR